MFDFIFRSFKNNYAPEDSGSGTATEELSVNETIELLGEDDDKEEVIDLDDKKDEKKLVKKDKETDEEKSEDDEEVELDDDEEKESDDEIDEDIITPPRRKEILAKYPQLFKDFPYLNRAYYREQQFTEMFPTMKDAKEAVNKSATLDKFESDLVSGNTEKILLAVKSHDQKAFNKIVDNYMDTLGKVDTQAYYHVLGNIIKDTIVSMVKESNNNGNEALKSAAAILNQFVFATSEFQPKTRLTPETEDTSKQDEISKRERALLERQFVSSRDEVSTKVTNVLKATIEANIDPKESMTPYVRKQAAREAYEEIISLVDRDSRFKQVLDRLWKQTLDAGFDSANKDKIKSAYLSKARTLLPTAIKKARNEALKGLGHRVKDDDTEETTTSPKRTQPSVGRATSSHNSGKSDKDKARAIPKDMSTRDYLMQE